MSDQPRAGLKKGVGAPERTDRQLVEGGYAGLVEDALGLFDTFQKLTPPSVLGQARPANATATAAEQ